MGSRIGKLKTMVSNLQVSTETGFGITSKNEPGDK
jgi:hypothetical protein